LTDALLTGALLTDANLRDVDLTGANVDGADLTNADLRNADLGSASLLGADLSGIRTDGGTNFIGAFYDAATIFGSGFDTTGMIFVPEPAQSSLLGLGLAILGMLRRRTSPPEQIQGASHRFSD
jgi:hypothetical protein